MAFSAVAQAGESTISPIKIYSLVGGNGSGGSSIGEITSNLNAVQEASFGSCPRGDSYDCTKFTITSVAPNGLFPIVNGEATFYDLNRTATTESKSGPGQPVQTNTVETGGLGIYLSFTCPAPYGAETVGNTAVCKLVKPEAQQCAGNPIKIGTGEKVEYEKDYSSADGVLSLERNYIDQDTGWSIQTTSASLVVIPPRAGGDTNTPYRVKLARYAVNEQGFNPGDLIEYYVDFPVRFYNPGTAGVAYLNLAGTRFRFDQLGNDFLGQGPSALRKKLTIIDPPNAGAKYKLEDANGDIYYFSNGGALLRQQLAGGASLTYQYLSGKVISMTDHLGRIMRYSYDADGRLTSVTPPDSQIITYTYVTNDKNARDFKLLKAVAWANGETVNYVYNEPEYILNSQRVTKALTGKVDGLGNRVGIYKYAYDQAVSTEGALGSFKRMFDFGYNNTTVTDGLNSQRTYFFELRPDGAKLLTSTSQPGGSGCAASTKSVTYYDSGFKKTEDDFNGNKTQLAYDAANFLETVKVEGIAQTDYADYLPAGSVVPAAAVKSTTLWHSQWRKPVKKTEPKLITTFIYNGDLDPFNANQVASCGPVGSSLLCYKVQQATTDVNGAAGVNATLNAAVPNREWFYTYNGRQQLVSKSRLAAGTPDESREYYETSGAAWRIGDLKSITNKLGHKSQFTQYDANGRVLTMLDENGVSTTYTYDLRGRLKTQNTGGLPLPIPTT